MKRIFAMMLSVLMMMSITTTAFAVDQNDEDDKLNQTVDIAVDEMDQDDLEDEDISSEDSVDVDDEEDDIGVEMPTASFVELPVEYYSYNEAEWILHVREATPSQYATLGVDSEEAEELKDVDLEAAFLERSKMSEAQLAALGHTEKEIQLLKAYDGSTITLDSEVLAASPKCKGGYYLKSASTSKMNFRYKWEWSSLPMFQGKDKVAVFWQAFNPKSVEIVPSSKYKKHIKYYRMSDGKFMYDQDKTIAHRTRNHIDGTIASVQMSKEIGGETVGNSYVWAKKGYVRVILNDSGANIKRIRFRGAYGHLTVGVEPTISVSLKGLIITFTPHLKIENVGNRYYEITSSGSVTKL